MGSGKNQLKFITTFIKNGSGEQGVPFVFFFFIIDTKRTETRSFQLKKVTVVYTQCYYVDFCQHLITFEATVFSFYLK